MKNSVWMIVDKIINMLAMVFWLALLARTLPKSDFGEYNFIIALVGILIPFASFGLNAQLNKLILMQDCSIKKVIISAISIRFGAALISILGIYIYVEFFVSTINKYLFVLYGIVLVFQSLQVYESLLQSLSKSKISTFSRLFVVSIFLILKTIIWYLGKLNLSVAVIIQMMELSAYYLALALFSYPFSNDLITKRNKPLKGFQFLFPYMTKSGIILVVSGVAEAINLRFDQIMINYYLGNEKVADYAIAARISESIYFFAAAIAASYFPALIKGKEKGSEFYSYSLSSLNFLLVSISLIFITFFAFFGRLIIINIFGESFSSSYDILMIHMLAAIFVFSRAVFSKWLVLENLLIFSVITHGLGAILNIFLNLYFIPKFGLKGAATATLISYSFSSYFSLCLFDKTRFYAKVITFNLFKYHKVKPNVC